MTFFEGGDEGFELADGAGLLRGGEAPVVGGDGGGLGGELVEAEPCCGGAERR